MASQMLVRFVGTFCILQFLVNTNKYAKRLKAPKSGSVAIGHNLYVALHHNRNIITKAINCYRSRLRRFWRFQIFSLHRNRHIPFVRWKLHKLWGTKTFTIIDRFWKNLKLCLNIYQIIIWWCIFWTIRFLQCPPSIPFWPTVEGLHDY